MAAPPTTIASLAEENQILMKYLQKKQLKKQKDLQKEKKFVGQKTSNQKPNTAQAVMNLARDGEFGVDFKSSAPRPQSKKVGRVTASNHDKAIARMVKSPNQIVFNPQTQLSADHSDMPEGQTMSSGKKLIRKVKKGGATGMSKSDINTMTLASGGQINLTASKSHHKNNMTLQQPVNGFNGPSMGMPSSSRVLSGNSQSSGGAANMKS